MKVYERYIIHWYGMKLWYVMKQIKSMKNILKLFYADIKKDENNQWKEVILFLIISINCITTLIKQVWIEGYNIKFFLIG